MNTPWTIADHDGRIIIVGADGSTITEILPALINKRWAVDKADRLAIAEHIVRCVNGAQNEPPTAGAVGTGDSGLLGVAYSHPDHLLPAGPDR